MKCELCNNEAHQMHHKDGNHKNNKPENLQYLCTLCHSKIHGIEPNYSKIRELITYFNRYQKTRIAIENLATSLSRIELIPPDDLQVIHKKLEEAEGDYEKQIKQFFKENPHKMYEWLKSIKGISDVLIAKLLSMIQIEKNRTEASLWHRAGLAPDDKKQKGQQAGFNPTLKTYCYQVVDSFIKQRTPKYREVYDKEKEKQLKRGLKRGHADSRARRKSAKVFLRDLHKRWRMA